MYCEDELGEVISRTPLSLPPPERIHPPPGHAPLYQPFPRPLLREDGGREKGEGRREKEHSFLVTSPRVGERPGEGWMQSCEEVPLRGDDFETRNPKPFILVLSPYLNKVTVIFYELQTQWSLSFSDC